MGESVRYRQGQGRMVWGLLKGSILAKFSQPRCGVDSSSSPCVGWITREKLDMDCPGVPHLQPGNRMLPDSYECGQI